MRNRVQGYRSIWIKNFGEIPIDEEGRSYEIHHIDGDCSNNDLSNLQCVSIKEHFYIHYNQGDFEAAIIIADRLGLSSGELDYLRIKGLPKQKISCPHCLKVGGIPAMKRWHFDNCLENPNIDFSLVKWAIRSSRLKGKSKSKEQIAKMTGPKAKVKCPHCNKEGGNNVMHKWHFNNCLLKPGNENNIRICPANTKQRVYKKQRGRPKKQL